MAPRDYARLHFQWQRDKVLRAVNRQAPGALTIWPILIALSKEQSNAVTNPAGIIETSWGDLADEAMLPVEQVQRIIELLSGDAEMVEVEAGRMDVIHVSLLRFGKWQAPRQSKAEHEQIRRDREAPSRDFVAERGGSVGLALVPFTETETETKVKPSRPSVPDELVRGVFDAWRDLFHRNANTRLDDKRRARIRWMLSRPDGKVVAWQVLKGYASDPWRHEATSRNEIRTLFRDEAAIDRGLELYAESKKRGDGGDEAARMGY